MDVWRFLFCTCLLVAVCDSTSFYSHLKKDEEFILREVRTLREADESETTRLTKLKTFTFTIGKEKIILKLKLNEHQTDHVPLKVITKYGVHLVKEDAPRDYAFYQNVDEPDATKAAVLVRCPEGEDCHIVGRFEHKGVTYLVEPCTHQPKKKGVMHGAHKVDVKNNANNEHDTKTIDAIKLDIKNAVPEKSHSQQKRAAVNHVIEVSMLIDYSIYKYWMEKSENDHALAMATIKIYYEHVANGMDRIYTTAATPTMTIDIMPLEILVCLVKESCGFIQSNLKMVSNVQYLDTNVIYSFNSWALQFTHYFKNYDAIMSFTRENMAAISGNTVQDGVIGLALVYPNTAGDPVSALCGDKTNYVAIAMVQDFVYDDVSGTAAHELAHTMGVRHDDQIGCSTASQYVMARASDSNSLTPSTASNPWTFSPCSINVLNFNMAGLAYWKGAALCTLHNSYNQADYNRVLTSKYLGEIYTLDQQCGFIYDGSVKCDSNEPDSDVCAKGMYCWITNTAQCGGRYQLLIGSRIGNKFCYKGRLVDTLP